jgi:hypothetical protein
VLSGRPFEIPLNLSVLQMYHLYHGDEPVMGTTFPPLRTTWNHSMQPAGGDPVWNKAQRFRSKKCKIDKIVEEVGKWVNDHPLHSVPAAIDSMMLYLYEVC